MEQSKKRGVLLCELEKAMEGLFRHVPSYVRRIPESKF